MTYVGLIASVALLIWLALRGVNIIFATLLCSLVVIVTNGLPLAGSLTQGYSLGPLGAFTFAGKFFLLFAAGAMFGRVMGESHAAASIAMALVKKLGAHRALWITTLACALLTYGGVVVFVVIFAMYPLGLKLLEQADIPKRLFSGAMALGAGTFTMTALPGTPSVHNVISSVALGTDLFAGPWLGLAAGAMMFGMGMWYLERERIKAELNGETFILGPNDKLADIHEDDYPHWILALLPLVTVLLTILMPRLIYGALSPETLANPGDQLVELIIFAKSQPLIWPSIALVIGTLLTTLMFKPVRANPLQIIGQGTQDSITPLINTAAVIGFGGVVVLTSGFADFTNAVVQSSLPPLLSMFASISLISGITGSASGGLQIFMQTLAPDYLAMGIDKQLLHRMVTIASGCFDSLPHSGAIVAILSITGQTHKEAYKDMAVVTVVIPTVTTLVLITAVFFA